MDLRTNPLTGLIGTLGEKRKGKRRYQHHALAAFDSRKSKALKTSLSRVMPSEDKQREEDKHLMIQQTDEENSTDTHAR